MAGVDRQRRQDGVDLVDEALPERVVVIPEMPLTPTRKIIKGRLRIPD